MRSSPIAAIVADLDDTLAYSSPKFTEAHVEVNTCRRALVGDNRTDHTRIVSAFLALMDKQVMDCDADQLIDALNAVKHWRNGFLASDDVAVRTDEGRIVSLELRRVGLVSAPKVLPVAAGSSLDRLIGDLANSGTVTVARGRLIPTEQPDGAQVLALESLAATLQAHICPGLGTGELPVHAVMDPVLIDDLLYRMHTWGTRVVIVTSRSKEMAKHVLRAFRHCVGIAGVQGRVTFVYENGRLCENGFDETHPDYWTDILYATTDDTGIVQSLAAIGSQALPLIRAGVDRLDLKRYELDVVLKSETARENRDAIARLAENAVSSAALDMQVSSYSGHVQIRPAGLNKGLAIDFLRSRYGVRPESMLVVGDAEPDLAMLERPGVHGFFVDARGWTKSGSRCQLARTMLPGRTNTELTRQVIRVHRFGTRGSPAIATAVSDPFVTESVEAALHDLPPGELNQVTARLWRAASADPGNEVLELLALLQQRDLPPAAFEAIVRILIGLRVDPTNPWTATYVLSDIVGHMSDTLCGLDISALKDVVRFRRNDTTRSDFERDFVLTPAEGSDAIVLKRQYQELRRRHHALITSSRSAREIATRVSAETNDFLERAFRVLLPGMLVAEGCPADCDALLYFADMKSFASDFDFLYWGPARSGVRRRIIDALSWFGVKSDPFAVLFLEDAIDSGIIDEYAYHSFNFRGRVVSTGRASFGAFHQEHIERHIDLGAMWRKVRPHMDSQFAIWNACPHPQFLKLTPADIKKLYYRAVFNLLFGLAVKYGISFVAPEPEFQSGLRQHLSEAELRTIFDTLDLVSQLRNVYQIVTRRRWEVDIDARTQRRIAARLKTQGVENIERVLREAGLELESIRQRHFGPPEYASATAKDIHSGEHAIRRWRRVARMFGVSRDEVFGGQGTGEAESSTRRPAPGELRTAPFPQEVDWFPVLKCSLDCAHCWSMGTVFDPSITRSLSVRQITRMVDIICERGVRAVTITGGEPTLWPDLEHTLRYLHDRGMLVRLYTHGLHCVDPRTGAIVGPAARRLDTVTSYTDTLSLSVDPYHDCSFNARFRALGSVTSYRAVVAEVLEHVARRRPDVDLQVISVVGRVPGADGVWWSEQAIADYYVSLGRELGGLAARLPRLRWKLNMYRYNASMRTHQAELRIDAAAFERLLQTIRHRCQPSFPVEMEIVRSQRMDYGYLFVRSDGTILSMKADGEHEQYIELGSFLTGSFREPEAWDLLRVRVAEQAAAVRGTGNAQGLRTRLT